MKIWQHFLLVACFAVAFSLRTTSAATRGMFFSMCVCVAIVPVALQSIIQLFQILARFAETPNASSFLKLMILVLFNLLSTGLIVGIIIRASFFVLWITL